MHSITFATELFVVVFSFICWLFYSPVETAMSPEASHPIEDCSELYEIVNSELQIEPLSFISEPETIVSKVLEVHHDDIVEDTSSGASIPEYTDIPINGNLVSVQESLSKKISELSITQARQVASKLKEFEILDSSTKLSGKGVTKLYLHNLIETQVQNFQETVREALLEVVNRA
jgi:hypothetical protein